MLSNDRKTAALSISPRVAMFRMKDGQPDRTTSIHQPSFLKPKKKKKKNQSKVPLVSAMEVFHNLAATTQTKNEKKVARRQQKRAETSRSPNPTVGLECFFFSSPQPSFFGSFGCSSIPIRSGSSRAHLALRD